MDFSVCCIKGCDEPSVALGLCNLHWRRNKRYGSPVATKNHAGMFQGRSAPERFAMQHKANESGCWIWTSSTDQDGYGAFVGEAAGQMFRRAHRWSWAHHNNQRVPLGAHICHTCDNPRCVNPAHLFLGTKGDNNSDMITKGRGRMGQHAAPAIDCAYQRGESHHAARLTVEIVRAIRADRARGLSYSAIASRHQISTPHAFKIVTRKLWNHV